MKINAEWYAHNKMPKNPTTEARIQWHISHARNCSCRPLDGKLFEKIKKRRLI